MNITLHETMVTGRAALARERLIAARTQMTACRLCPAACGVNRLEGARGQCLAGDVPHVFQAQIETADETEIAPAYGICLSGCNMRCSFCITGAKSWNPDSGGRISADLLAKQARQALNDGARTILFLGGEPTIHPVYLMDVISRLPDDACLVLKTNGRISPQGMALLDGLFDIWCVDCKFGNDSCALRLSGTPNYTATLQECLLRLSNLSAGPALLMETPPRIILRHLLMPGHLDCCWGPVAQWVSSHMPGATLSLHAGFWPGWKSGRHEELRRSSSPVEEAKARQMAMELGIRLAA